MKKKKLTLLVDSELLDEYKTHCDKEGIIISRQVEKMMKKHLHKE